MSKAEILHGEGIFKLMVPEQADVVVCGGGMSGLSAALASVEAGAKVVLVEKAPHCGGSLLLSGGLVWTIKLDQIDELLPGTDKTLAGLVIDRLRTDVEWLRQFGLRRIGPEEDVRSGSGFRIDPDELVEVATRLLLEAGATILTSTSLTSLEPSSESVEVGVLTATGQDHRVSAGSVVVATGGFQGNAELVRRYLGIAPENLRLRANPWSTGDGLVAALNCGAALTGAISQFYGHALAESNDLGGEDVTLRHMSQQYGRFGIAINRMGRRFADESAGTGEEILNQELARQPGGQGFYIVDSEIAHQRRLSDGEFAITAIRRAQSRGSVVVESETLDELIRDLAEEGVPYEVLKSTVENYNGHVERSTPRKIYPARKRNRDGLCSPPYFAVQVRAGVTMTLGGLAVSENMRVLRQAAISSQVPSPAGLLISNVEGHVHEERSSFKRMFAAGVDAGISSGGYMGGLSVALVTGRIAGMNAARPN